MQHITDQSTFMPDEPNQHTLPPNPPPRSLEEIEVASARLLHVRASGKLGIVVALVCLLWISALVFLFR